MARFSHYEKCPQCAASGRDTRGDNLGVYVDGSQHCFSCGYHKHPRGYIPIDRNLEVKHGTKSLPSDFTREVPARAWEWLLQYGLPWSYWKDSCGYSEAYGGPRLVFQVGSPTEFSIGRLLDTAVGNHKDRRKWWVWGDSHKHCEVVHPKEAASQIILVEDLISAHKVGQVTTCIPLFGTNIHPCHLFYLTQEQKPVKIWLDKDQEGLVVKKAVRLQILIGQPVDIIVTDKDPKTYSVDKIRELTLINTS